LDITVFVSYKDDTCSQCNGVISSGDMILLENRASVCLSCADLDHLFYLPSGNTALTIRARRYSTLSAIVKKFSRVRKRSERQGVLVEQAALEKAEAECLADEQIRARRRARDTERRSRLDAAYVTEFAKQIQARYPSCPEVDALQMAQHACQKHSGRVGRIQAAKAFETWTVDLAVQAHVRHTHTDYDQLLASGWIRETAREGVHDRMEHMLAKWRTLKKSS
jgi:hypothetical protein